MSSTGPTLKGDRLAPLSEVFEWYADRVFHGSSPLYEWLARRAADDPELLALALNIPRGQPAPNLLFGAAHYLMLSGVSHPAAAYFPSVTPSPLPVEEAYPHFRSLCLDHADRIIPLLKSRRVQTNEVRRCATLVPAFEVVSRQEDGRPLALVEIGPSAGLNLLWDRYGYVYNRVLRVGDPASPVQITCEARGDSLPPLPDVIPPAVYRVGIDVTPGDVRDQEMMLWQRAMLWPDQPERAELFWQAVEVARQESPRIINGDALDVLPAILDEIPPEAVVGVYHSFVLNQFASEARHALKEILKKQSHRCTLYRVSIEWYSGQANPQLELFSYRGGEENRAVLAGCDQHGRWLEWLAGLPGWAS